MIFCALFFTAFSVAACSFGDSDNTTPAPAVISPVDVDSEQAQSMETLAALSAPAGLNTKRLFATPVASEQVRFTRLENEVQKLRDEFDLVSPAITRLVAVEQDMRDLMAQLETLIGGEPPQTVIETSDADIIIPEPVTTIDAPQNITQPILEPVTEPEVVETTTTVVESTTTTNLAGLPQVKEVRIGEHIDKTRIVLDMTDKADYTLQMSADNKQVELLLKDTNWYEVNNWSSAKSPVIKSWFATQTGADVKVVFTLTYPGRIKYDAFVAPRDGFERLVVDVFSDEMHLAK